MEVEFGVRQENGEVRLVSVPEEFGAEHPGFVDNLPSALQRRSVDYLRKMGIILPEGNSTIIIREHDDGRFICSTMSFGRRKTCRVYEKGKVLLDTSSGFGIRLCFLPEEWQGKRLQVLVAC